MVFSAEAARLGYGEAEVQGVLGWIQDLAPMCSLAPIRAAGAQVGDGDRENDVFPKNVGGEGFQKKGVCIIYHL